MTRHVTGDGAAELFRSYADFFEELDYADSELIGNGTLDKMIRLALSDPDDEVWRYSIRSGDHIFRGDAIRTLRES